MSIIIIIIIYLFCCSLCVCDGSCIIAHSQGVTNGLSGRDYRVLTISLFYVQK